MWRKVAGGCRLFEGGCSSLLFAPAAEMFACLFFGLDSTTHWAFVQLSSSRFVCLARKWTSWQTVIYGCAYLFSCNTILLSLLPFFLPPPVDIREIRELRLGKGSRDFERYPEEARKLDSAHCFIMLYGLEFRLRTLSVAGKCVFKLLCLLCVFTVTVDRLKG